MIDLEQIRKAYGSEMALVILICRIRFRTAGNKELQNYLANTEKSIDWKLFIKIASLHQIRPFIYEVLSQHGGYIKADVLIQLKNSCMKIATKNLQNLRELLQIHSVLKNENVENLPYKGVLLSHMLFGDYTTRETVDIDILVQSKDFSRAKTVLESYGYQTAYYYNATFEKRFLQSDNELLFQKALPAGLSKVELHWEITHKMMDIPLPVQRIFGHTNVMSVMNHDTRVLNLHGNMLLLLVHHGVNDVWRTLRHNIDISMLLWKYREQIDWTEIMVDCNRYKILKTAQYGLTISYMLFGIPIPDAFRVQDKTLQKIWHNLLRFPPLKKKKLSLENILQQMAVRDSVADKLSLALSYIRGGITPNMRDVEAFPLPKALSGAYYMIKPLRLLFGKFK